MTLRSLPVGVFRFVVGAMLTALPAVLLAGDGSVKAPVFTITAIQDSEGLLESDLSPALAKRMEAWSVSASRKKMADSLRRAGQDPALAYRVPIKSESLVLEVGSKKLIVVRLLVDGVIREITAMGFNGPFFYRVGCIRMSHHDIPLFEGECGRAVSKALGVSVP